MASNRIRWDGLEQLRKELRNLPAELADEASGIVLGEAYAAAQEIEAAYSSRTGNLKNGMDVVKAAAGRFGVGAVVINRAKHAWLFENGTQARHNDLGANRGSMPAGHVFIPRVIRHRRAMYGKLADLLTRHGLIVSGTP